MTIIGALGFGAVLGWAASFVALSLGGALFRATLIIPGAALAALYGMGALVAVLIGVVGGAIGHEFLLATLRERRA